MVSRERGITVLEVIVGLAVVTILCTGIPISGRAQLAAVHRSFDELVASRAAASRLAALRADGRAPQAGPFDPGVEGGRGLQEVREVRKGLFEVTVTVAAGGAEVALTTLVLPEAEG